MVKSTDHERWTVVLRLCGFTMKEIGPIIGATKEEVIDIIARHGQEREGVYRAYMTSRVRMKLPDYIPHRSDQPVSLSLATSVMAGDVDAVGTPARG